jgi:hypothetical protein
LLRVSADASNIGAALWVVKGVVKVVGDAGVGPDTTTATVTDPETGARLSAVSTALLTISTDAGGIVVVVVEATSVVVVSAADGPAVVVVSPTADVVTVVDV